MPATFALALAAIVCLPIALYGLFVASVWLKSLLPAALALLAAAAALFAYIFANQSPDFYVFFFLSGFVLWAGLAGLAARGILAWLRRRYPRRFAPAGLLAGGFLFLAAVWPVSRFVLPW